MPLFMDVHNEMEGMTPEQIAEAHERDLEIQDEHGVTFHKYWFDEDAGKVFCLSEAPNRKAAEAVHREAGHPADEIFEVTEGS